MEFWFVILLLSLVLALAAIALRHRKWPVRTIRQLLDRLLKSWMRQPGTVDLLSLLGIATVACAPDHSVTAQAHLVQGRPLNDQIVWQSAATKEPRELAAAFRNLLTATEQT